MWKKKVLFTNFQKFITKPQIYKTGFCCPHEACRNSDVQFEKTARQKSQVQSVNLNTVHHTQTKVSADSFQLGLHCIQWKTFLQIHCRSEKMQGNIINT